MKPSVEEQLEQTIDIIPTTIPLSSVLVTTANLDYYADYEPPTRSMDSNNLRSRDTEEAYNKYQTFSFKKSKKYMVLYCSSVREPLVPNWRDVVSLGSVVPGSKKTEVTVKNFTKVIYKIDPTAQEAPAPLTPTVS